MRITIQMDGSGRLVLPRAVRERLNLTGGVSLQVDVLAGRIELTPLCTIDEASLSRKSGITVLTRVGAKVDAASAVAAEREAQEERGRRR